MNQKLATLFPRAWAEQARWLYALWPLSKLYGLVIRHRRQMYAQGKLASYKAPVPVMIIGNITVGGSGKTPLIIELVNFLQLACAIKVGVISRGYGGQGPFPQLVSHESSPEIVGDEPVLITRQTQVPMAVGPNRQASIELLLKEHPELDIILSDDGLQHLALQRDIEWIVLDVDRGLGNEQLLPCGFLREPVERLKTATVIEHGLKSTSTLTMHLKPSALIPLREDEQQPKSVPAGQPIEQLKLWLEEGTSAPKVGQTIHAVAGIGHPRRFFESLRNMGFHVIEHAFPDHHAYTPANLDFPDHYPIITTAKDAVKMLDFAHLIEKNIWILPVQAHLSIDCYRTLHQQLTQLGLKLPPFAIEE